MHQNKLFTLTRGRLAGLYTGIIGLILAGCGLAFYLMMAQAHWQALHRELESVAGTLHDSLEPVLKEPGRIEPDVRQILPGLCLSAQDCPEQMETVDRHILGTVQQDSYYARLLNRSGDQVAVVGVQPQGSTGKLGTELWQTLQIPSRDALRPVFDHRYHQISLPLKTQDQLPWGYLQVGRSLEGLDDHLATMRLLMLAGFPVALLLVYGASWWLAGLAMLPVYQSYQQIQQFTADAAHELRTPLAAAQATVESTLELEELPESEARDTLQTLERQVGRLSQIVRDLLLLSRMDLQRLPLKRQPCCFNMLIYDLADEFEALAVAAQVQLIPEIQVDQPLIVEGDEEQLYRATANLITNAIQYTPPDGQVRILLNQEDNQAILQVQDTGVGIAPEEQAYIFDRFYRASSDRSRKTGGSGLGLSIAQATVKAHGGKLQVQSQLGKGSTFTIRLPLQQRMQSK